MRSLRFLRGWRGAGGTPVQERPRCSRQCFFPIVADCPSQETVVPETARTGPPKSHYASLALLGIQARVPAYLEPLAVLASAAATTWVPTWGTGISCPSRVTAWSKTITIDEHV